MVNKKTKRSKLKLEFTLGPLVSLTVNALQNVRITGSHVENIPEDIIICTTCWTACSCSKKNGADLLDQHRPCWPCRHQTNEAFLSPCFSHARRLPRRNIRTEKRHVAFIMPLRKHYIHILCLNKLSGIARLVFNAWRQVPAITTHRRTRIGILEL